MKWKIFLILPLILLLTGCATGKRLQSLETKVAVLETKVDVAEQRQSNIEGQTGESRESMGYLKGKVESISTAPQIATTKSIEGNRGYVYKSGKRTLTKKDIQSALKNAGFYDGPIDGKIGRATKKAIKEFQKTNGLKADGIIGKNTRNLLIQYLERQEKQ